MGDPVTVEKFAIGQSVRRIEDARLLRGLGRYSEDVDLPRQAYAVLVRSPHAHARIAGIDARAALSSPGVLAVLTGADLAADGVGNLPTDRTRKRRDGAPAFATPRPLLARERVRHVGDPVVLVVADTREHAVDAAEHVAVEYTPLLAATLGVEQNRVRVVSVDVGGSFGMRSGLYPEMALVLWAGKRLGRPVKWISDRREGMLTDEAGRDNVSTVELALDRDGTFLALRIAVTLNVGAYLTPRSAGPGTNNVGGVAGMYRTPAIHHETTGVYTNTTPTGPYRGAGRPEATYAIERVIDVAARELGIDPIGLRRRNLIPPSAMPFKTGLVFTYACGDFARGMDLAPSRVQVLSGDTDALGAGRGNGGSGALTVGGSAVLRATDKVIERGRRIAAHLLEAAPEDVALRDGKFAVAGTDRGVTFAEVARAAYVPKQLPPGLEPGFSETAAFMPPSVTFPNGGHVCEVEVDGATGGVRLVRHTVVADVGRVVNPMPVTGRIHGR